jgi:hypothetical protein
MPSVMQDWTNELSIRQQGVLVLALRKESTVKPIVRAMRACVMTCAFMDGKPMPLSYEDADDPFMSTKIISEPNLWVGCINMFFADMDEHNVHFLQHFAHAACVLGYKHPVPLIRLHWDIFYKKLTRKLHWHPETESDINWRLRDGKRPEDRLERQERRCVVTPLVKKGEHL